MKQIIITIVTIFAIISVNAIAELKVTNKTKNDVKIHYEGFNNEQITYDRESKSLLSTNKNNSINKYFRQSKKFSKVVYQDFDNKIYESKDYRYWSLVDHPENYIQVENKTMNNQELNLNVYPNPTLDMFSVNINSKSETNITLILNDVTKETRIELIKISNFKGDINKTFNSNELGLVRGVYFITLQTNQGIILKRFIKI